MLKKVQCDTNPTRLQSAAAGGHTEGWSSAAPLHPEDRVGRWRSTRMKKEKGDHVGVLIGSAKLQDLDAHSEREKLHFIGVC